MTAHPRRQWTPPSGQRPRSPPGGDVNTIPWIPAPARPIVFKNASVVDVAGNTVHKGRTVVLENGVFSAVSRGAGDLVPDARVIDLEGLYLCPGLVDCHVHINMSDGRPSSGYTDPHLRATYTLKAMLARGFTTVRDVGGATYAQAQAVKQWLTPGPRLFQGGNIYRRARRPAVARGARRVALLRAGAGDGADHVKICTSGGVSSPTDALESVQFSPAEIRAITSTVADMQGTLVTSHAYTVPAIRRAVENGVRGIEHGNLLDRDTAKLLASTGTFLTPTLMISTAKGRAPWNETLPDYMREKNAKVRDAGRRAIQIAEEEGVTVCYGTDLTMGMGYLQSEEFTQRAQLLPSHRVLAHATINAAKLLDDDKIGVIAPGAYADCLVLPANPLEDVRVLDVGDDGRHGGIWGVVRDGRIVVARGEFAELVEEVGGLDVVLGIQEAA
ncbi:hypothetical protein Q8F55_009292 [Vanrija albida]|uniref:Amidohydrolase-related domain-containing protein n=1 Tax=Vanrija albida TaxID=181172 RepID=A0ABR3PT84_9TREE